MSRFAGDTYHPRYTDDRPPRPPPAAEKAMYHFGGGQRNRGDFSFRKRIAERDLLTHFPTTQETSVLASNHTSDKFRDVDNLTDSEEEEMDEDVSDREDNDRVKRRKIGQTDGNAESSVKWSNPDPYTALPPPTETTGKRVDVLKLIRKARNDPVGQNSTSADQEDFISFDTADDDQFAPPANAPAGPKADTRAQPASAAAVHPSRKRKRAEYESDRLMGAPGRQFHASGAVLTAWRAISDDSPTPWLEASKATDAPMVALHKEILDFYEWVKPHDFEAAVREDLISRLGTVLRRYNMGCQLKSFGSYAAGLYLPTGDMDLVCFLPGVRNDSVPVSKGKMFQISNFIERDGLARLGSVVVISGAKVPIIKFVDDQTGLKVDLSFSNTTGIVANDTFKKWQVTYPAMPIIVAVMKQFLMIRGLNDNSVGGLGGFATICMVTSLIQNLPASKGQNLGELLVEFFNLYGNLLDITSIGIRMDPPGFIDKYRYPPLRDEKMNRLMIIDPNRPDNNITGGSSEILRIVELFSRTHEILMARLDEFANPQQRNPGFSFLGEFIGGNFAAYQEQRRSLHRVYNNITGIPPPFSPPSLPTVVPPPPPKRLPAVTKQTGNATADKDDSGSEAGPANNGSISNKSQKRLERVKRLCPELLPKLSNLTTLAKHKALNIGGWKDMSTMSKDLEYREKQQARAAKAAKKA
ncbi:hypothetical protein OHC33_001483 [Knufia fluminis]|uniref:polynucleotide adenylyltransferase n=1 Tax=Knufia fluminis TaxID=191047 RepID=A0AAN8EJL0_9EURO|nr:hypothetical protein OHC33_001483 [Knufia fluminis]